MRKRFEQQLKVGYLLIEDTEIPTSKRSGALPSLCSALKEIFSDPKWNEKVFEILEREIFPKNNKTGRPGMDLWHIFVLSQVRLCQNLSYDELEHVANYDSLVRQIMGIESYGGFPKKQFHYQTIIDNVSLLDDKTVMELNDVIVEFGHKVFKKKEDTALRLKTDSFVVQSNVHFPTDYNLLWDSARKSLDMISKLLEQQHISGWRKINNWRKELKNKMRAIGRASVSGGKGKEERLKSCVREYLAKAKALLKKLKESREFLSQEDNLDVVIITHLVRFMELLEKHIDLLYRRVLKGEKIPHSEKMFSIFEEYTEWITKGKMRPNVELGKKLSITTDQYNMIVDYHIMDHECDSQIVPQLLERMSRYSIESWSFDKGYWDKENKSLLSQQVTTVVLPKKGKCNQIEAEEEQRSIFKKLRHKHSAIESNINELEHCGLDRCPDKGYEHFKRYIGLAVGAYNLKRIGLHLLLQAKKKSKGRIAA